MRIACPSCAAEYDVPASRVTPGKMVRCARCGGEWMAADQTDDVIVTAEPEASQPEVLPEVLPEPPIEPVASQPRVTAPSPAPSARHAPPRRVGLIGAWLLTAVVLVGAVAAAVTWREAIVRSWPASSRILAPADRVAPKPAQVSGKDAP
jgi:predicted Zn finger-like uncharacterized protein